MTTIKIPITTIYWLILCCSCYVRGFTVNPVNNNRNPKEQYRSSFFTERLSKLHLSSDTSVISVGSNETDGVFLDVTTTEINPYLYFHRYLIRMEIQKMIFLDNLILYCQNKYYISYEIRVYFVHLLDGAVFLGIPSLIEQYPSSLGDFIRLLSGKEWIVSLLPTRYQQYTQLQQHVKNNIQQEKIQYGNHKNQYVRIISRKDTTLKQQQQQQSYLICTWWYVSSYLIVLEKFCHDFLSNHFIVIFFFFVGAWGSGFPELYLLLASPFINQGYTFAVIGYRTYPDADCIDQSIDVKDAIQSTQKYLSETRGRKEVRRDYTLMAHSSGCHICALGFTKGIFDSSLNIDRFVSMAGVFDIPQHYRWEIARGVARFSPMAQACRRINDKEVEQHQPTKIDPIRTLAGWRENSPIYDLVSNKEDYSIQFPEKCYIVHGTEDTTCPYNYSQDFGNALKIHPNAPSLVDVDILDTGHAEMVVELMFGGRTRDAVLSWLEGTSSSIDER